MGNYRLLAIELGQLLKYSTTLREIDRYAGAIFSFQCQSFPNEAITSQRAQLIYDWIMTASQHCGDGAAHSQQLLQFCRMLAFDDASRESINRVLDVAGFTSDNADSSSKGDFDTKLKENATRRRELDDLLQSFDGLFTSPNHQQRGYALQDLLPKLFGLFGIPIIRSFTRNDGAEQIDGAFRLDGWHYVVECRWRKALADIRELDGLKGQIDRSGKQTMGVFLSIDGWSQNVPKLMKQNPDKSIILMDGYDLRSVLNGSVDLTSFLLAKLEKLNLDSEPFYGAGAYLKDIGNA